MLITKENYESRDQEMDSVGKEMPESSVQAAATVGQERPGNLDQEAGLQLNLMTFEVEHSILEPSQWHLKLLTLLG